MRPGTRCHRADWGLRMDRFQFESVNFRGHFIRHRNFQGELTRKDRPAEDFFFTLQPRGSQGLVALRSVNFPDRFLRHRDFRVFLEGPSGPQDQLFRLDSSFFLEPGLADPNGFSLRSFNFRDRFLRHRDFHLFVEPEDSPNLAPDATFFRSLAPVLIDHGTEGQPADT
jgi:Alpha-L-arabinofuranosidase B (ABFB) domain